MKRGWARGIKGEEARGSVFGLSRASKRVQISSITLKRYSAIHEYRDLDDMSKVPEEVWGTQGELSRLSLLIKSNLIFSDCVRASPIGHPPRPS